jgi:short-subunit dehydrogenase
MKKAIVIGATSGIGKSISEILIQNNYVVGVSGRRLEMLTSLKEKHLFAIYLKRNDFGISLNLSDSFPEII